MENNTENHNSTSIDDMINYLKNKFDTDYIVKEIESLKNKINSERVSGLLDKIKSKINAKNVSSVLILTLMVILGILFKHLNFDHKKD